MPTSLGPAEILVILVVALIVLGPKRLPDAGRQVGKFISEVRHWSSAVQGEIQNVINAESEAPPPPPTAAPNIDQGPPAVPTPVDLSPTPEALSAPPLPPAAATPAPGPAVPVSSSTAAEWGLAPTAEPDPEAKSEPAADAPTVNLPAEWATPPPHSDN